MFDPKTLYFTSAVMMAMMTLLNFLKILVVYLMGLKLSLEALMKH